MPEHLANAIIIALLRRLGVTELVLSQADIEALQREPLRMEGLTIGHGVRVMMVPNDPILLARLAHRDLRSIERTSDPRARAQLMPGAQMAYAQALAGLTPEQLGTLAPLLAKPLTPEDTAFSMPVAGAETPSRRSVLAVVQPSR